LRNNTYTSYNNNNFYNVGVKLKVKAFSSSSFMELTKKINDFFNGLEEYAIWHISNIIEVEERHMNKYFKILIFYDEEVEELK